MKNLLKFLILAALPLFAQPFTAEDASATPTVGNCFDLSLKPGLTFAWSDKRQYEFMGKCLVYDFNEIRSAEILAVYDRQTGEATESLSISGLSSPYTYVWQCNNDPWLYGAATCTPTPNSCASVPYQLDLQYCKGYKPSYGSSDPNPPWNQPLHAPLTKPGSSAVQAYLSAVLAEKAAPLIQNPGVMQIYPTGTLTVAAQYAPPHNPAFYSNWEINYTYPPGASTVEFEWQRWKLARNGSGGSWVADTFLANINLDGPGATVDTVFKEGAWRVRARHAVSGWPWTNWWQAFWIGDKVDYAKPMAVIQSPEQNQIHTEGGPGLYKVDFVVTFNPNAALYDPYVPTNLVEVQLDWFQTGSNGKIGYGVIDPIVFVKTAGDPFTQHLNPGAWRVRARHTHSSVPGNSNYPWSEWREFSTGLPDLKKIHDALMGGQSGGVRIDAEIAKKLIEALGSQGVQRLDPETTEKLIKALNSDQAETLDAKTAKKLIAALQGGGDTGLPDLKKVHDAITGVSEDPDLVVAGFFIFAFRKGDTLPVIFKWPSGAVAGQTYWFPLWFVKNKGLEGTSNPILLKVTCKATSFVPCPPGITGIYDVLPLEGYDPESMSNYPTRGAISDALIPAPDLPATFEITATVDHLKVIPEGNEFNNTLVSAINSALIGFDVSKAVGLIVALSGGVQLDAEIAKKLVKALGNQGMQQLDPKTHKKLIKALNSDRAETLDAATAAKLVAALQNKAPGGGLAGTAKPGVAVNLVPPLEEQPRSSNGGPVQPALNVASIMVTGKTAAGQPVNLMVALKNTSDKPIEANLKGLNIACVAPSGATCTIQKARTFMGLTLQPGQTRTFKLAVKPSTGGPYKVSIVPHNAPASSGRNISVAVAQAPVSSRTLQTPPRLKIVPKSPLRQ